MNRRQLLQGIAAACLVAGFDPIARRWMRKAEASPPSFDPLPDLDGSVTMDEATLEVKSTDSGYVPIGSVDMTPADWVEHFGAAGYANLSRLKERYDPARILTPGPGMF